MIEKLELKHLAPYLPYGLRVIEVDFINKGETYNSLLIGLVTYDEDWLKCTTKFNDIIEDTEPCNIKPILHPLSDLTKKIEVNGERLVPIDEFFIMYGGGFANKQAFLNTGFLDSILRSPHETFTYSLITKLFEWHFDVFGLIPSGLAIDINTLKL